MHFTPVGDNNVKHELQNKDFMDKTDNNAKNYAQSH